MSVTEQSAHDLYQAAFAPRPDLDAAVRTRLRRVALTTDVLGVLAGVWLLCAPSVLGYTLADRGPAAFYNSVAIAAATALLALIGASSPLNGWPGRVARLTLGGWLLIAPAVLGSGGVTAAVADEVAVGVASVLLAFIGLRVALVARRIG